MFYTNEFTYKKKLGNPYFVCSSPTYPLCDENVSYPILFSVLKFFEYPVRTMG